MDSRTILGPSLLVLAMAALAGCQSVPQAAAPTAPARAAIAAEPAAAAPIVLSATRAAPAPVIVGLNRRAIRKLLGEPRLIRRDDPAEVWQYRTAACVLDLVLYKEKNEPRVAYAEARTPAADPTPTDSCVAEVAAQRRHLSNS